MIKQTSFSPEWLQYISDTCHIGDLAVLERVIHAFSLLEMLVQAGLDFVFKGGTCLMLHFPDKLQRMSVDIDVICPPGTDIAPYLERFADFGFSSMEEINRVAPEGHQVPKGHMKLNYRMTFPKGETDSLFVFLDVLYDDCHYKQVEQHPIKLPIWESEGEELSVAIPSIPDILADKLTAFAPNTTGVPYEKKGEDSSAEVIKQLYDVGRLFDKTNDMITVAEVFHGICHEELQYRGNRYTEADVYEDIRNTAMCLALNGKKNEAEYKILNNGVTRFKGFLFDKRSYNMHKATTDAAKAAYLATAIQYSATRIEHYAGPESIPQGRVLFNGPLHKDLSKLKRDKPEAYFYWTKIAELLPHE